MLPLRVFLLLRAPWVRLLVRLLVRLRGRRRLLRFLRPLLHLPAARGPYADRKLLLLICLILLLRRRRHVVGGLHEPSGALGGAPLRTVTVNSVTIEVS